MWLHVANSNNDSKIVAKHFIDCVCPVEVMIIIML